MKTITLNKTNTKHISGNNYEWKPDNSEPYNLIVEDGININTYGGDISTDGGDTYTHGGYIYTCGGNIYTDGGYIYTHGGYINTVGGDIDTSGGYIYTGGGNIYTYGGDIYTDGGYIDTDGGDIISHKINCGVLYWLSMEAPDVEEIECKIIYPDLRTRSHWQERLSDWVDVSEGCYDELLEKIRPHLDNILASDKWSKCERWIIESWEA